MELEEAIKELTFQKEYLCDTYPDKRLKQGIETVLQELEYKDEQIDKLYNENIELENYKSEYEKGNLIHKKKIEDKIKEYMEYDKKVKTYTSDGRENFTMEYFYAKNLQELLEDK